MSNGLINRAARFSSDVAWTLSTRLLMVVNSVAAGVIVAHWLGAEGVGQLAVINIAVTTIVQLGSLGLPSSNTYFIAQDRKYFRAATVNSLLFALVVGTFLAIALSALASLRPDWFGFVSPQLIRIAAVSIPSLLLTLIALNIFLAVGKVREFNLLDLVAQSCVLINAVFVLVVFRKSLPELVALNTITTIAISLIVAVLLVTTGKKLVDSKWRSDAALLRRMIAYGLKFHISVLAGAIIFRADLLVVNHFRGAAEAGVYSVATQFSLLLMLL
ncbi:MAG TPA: oligosaccharide flippase family protein, partial [Pyrinomonadaceae bacterium]|nr:oligosaccharide flippase family protein [Pyrinomonadaceae bacterium]